MSSQYLSSVKLGSKTSRIPNGFRAAALMDNGGETDNDRCLNSGGSKEISTCKVSNIMGDLKEPLCTRSPSMDNTFWDPLPFKVGKFLYQMIILQKNWTYIYISNKHKLIHQLDLLVYN